MRLFQNPLFDTHVHLKDEETDPAGFCSRAADAGVSRLLFFGDGMEQCSTLAHIAETRDGVYFGAGVHPHSAATMKEDFSEYAARFQKCRGFVSIGEIGLDFYYDFSDEASQVKVFSGFLDLALSLDLPACIHVRDKAESERAYELTYELLVSFCRKGGRCVLHAFAGSVVWRDKFLALDHVWFGVGGMVTFKKADNIREVAAGYPIDRILLETDSPYLAPVPFRGQENHPALLPYIADALAKLRGLDPEDMIRTITKNSLRLYCPGELVNG